MLYCDNNQLTKLDISKNEWLEELSCYGNQITRLNVKKNEHLYRLDCDKKVKIIR